MRKWRWNVRYQNNDDDVLVWLMPYSIQCTLWSLYASDEAWEYLKRVLVESRGL